MADGRSQPLEFVKLPCASHVADGLENASARMRLRPMDGGFELSSDGLDPVALGGGDLDGLMDAWAERWLRVVAVEIGLGFHPDTPAGDYEPALEGALAEEYDRMLDFVFERLEDPYAVGLDAWEMAGLIQANDDGGGAVPSA